MKFKLNVDLGVLIKIFVVELCVGGLVIRDWEEFGKNLERFCIQIILLVFVFLYYLKKFKIGNVEIIDIY